MKKEEWNEGLNHLESDVIEKYVEQRDGLMQKNKKSKNMWIRFGAMAACLCLILGAISIAFKNTPDIEPYFPDGKAWSPVISSNVKDIVLSADKVSGVFDLTADNNGTNQYTEIYAPTTEYLGIYPLPDAEYLPIYSSGNSNASKNSLEKFIDKYLDTATAFYDINTKNYTIEKDEMYNGNILYGAEVSESRKGVRFIAKNNSLYFDYYTLDDKRLKINGEMISVMESYTDEQIKETLRDTISYVCSSFGKNYTDIKICRSYSSDQLRTINIYLYSPEETILPPNFYEAPMTSDYITLTLYTDWGSGRYCHWGGAKDEAYLSKVSLYETNENWKDYFRVDAKAKMLTLEEAEQLLEKGYVFGGHSCPLCMQMQQEVDFSEYTFVDIEYVSNQNGEMYIPFYAFYKEIHESDSGIVTYAKTYVPAVQVSGLDEYFELQKSEH